jgi:hypothetical protein
MEKEFYKLAKEQVKNGIDELPKTKRRITNETILIKDLLRVANLLGAFSVSVNQYKKFGRYDYACITRRFGSWNEGILASGLDVFEWKGKTRTASPGLRYRVFARDGFRCVICGRNVKEDKVKLQADYIIPYSAGGRTVLDNMQTLCRDCNVGKWKRYQ